MTNLVPSKSLVVYLIIALSILSQSRGELFTAIVEVESLLDTQKRTIDDLDNYIRKEEKRLKILKKYIDIYKAEHKLAMEDIPNYLGNPINAFKLIKRLTIELDHIEQTIKLGTEYIKNIIMIHDDVKYPTLEDLTGAAQALSRLQKTYHLDVGELAQGILNGVAYSTPMSAGDCYELGRILYNTKDYKTSLRWMHEALRRYRLDGDKAFPFDEADILEYISFSYYLLDDIPNALEWTKKLLRVNPNHERAAGNIPHYKQIIVERKAKLKKLRRGDTGDDNDVIKQRPNRSLTTEERSRKVYESLCRGEMDIPIQISSKLTCRYITENHPFLRLAPIKMEQRYVAPDVYVFYNVMSDGEIEYVKSMSKPRLERAMVQEPKTGEAVQTYGRVGKLAWLNDKESEVIGKISQRVSDFTGLSVESAEELQVVNYGIGGFYAPHFDFERKHDTDTPYSFLYGKRTATVVFYMSDVAQGGATVFTELGLTIFPIKSAALFWLNLHPSGEGDIATQHAGCPVLIGSKWISNKWIHQIGQEFIKPCNLNYQDENVMRKILEPVPKSPR